MPKAFISYARDGSHGENLAIEIQQQLQVAGFAVFRDVTGLKPGDPWFHKLEFELESSDVMVLVVSEKVRTSKWVHNEVSMAEEIGIPVIPVLAEVIRQPLWVRHLQVLDFCGARDWRVLLEVVAGCHSDGGKLPHTIPTTKEKAKEAKEPLVPEQLQFNEESASKLFSNREIQQRISNAAQKLSAMELGKLCQERESKAIFGLSFPLFVRIPIDADQTAKQEAIKRNEINRWTWKFEFEKEGYIYAICTQWYRRQDALVQKWLEQHE